MRIGETLVRRLPVGACLRVGVARLLLRVRSTLPGGFHTVARLGFRRHRFRPRFGLLGEVRGRLQLVGHRGRACLSGLAFLDLLVRTLVNQLMEARDERRLLKLQRDLQAVKLLIVDELGYVSLSATGAELLFETFSQRYERGSTVITSNLPFEDWTAVLGSERLTGALLDRLTHHVSILTMNGDSYRLKQSVGRRRASVRAEQNQATSDIVDADTGEITIS